MRLSSFHVDGFGALADFGEEEIAPGLVVVLGPNEAGKSTLFDFLTGVLFGFPSRKDNPKFRAPVRGGRHGGRVGFVDEAGGCWVVERHAGAQRGLVVRLPDGSEGDAGSLSRALAGASSSLFEAVFAVGLDDLGQMKNLESDEVRELLFAASIFGQRRSATKAMKHLSEARDELARPRREEATANRLAVELEGVRAELAGARQEAGRYDGLQRQASQVDGELQAMRAQLKEMRDRERELQLLENCWQHHRRAEAARLQLASLPPLGQAAALIEHAVELRELANERSGHFERVEKLEDLLASRAGLEASLERRLRRMGPGWTRSQALDAPAPQALSETVRSARDRLNTLRTDLASAEAVRLQAEGLLAAVPADERDGDDVPGRAELEEHESALSELRDRLGEAERLRLEALADEQALALGVSTQVPPHDLARAAVIALLLSGLVVGALGIALFAGGRAGLAALSLTVGLILVAGSGLVWRMERRNGDLRHRGAGGENGPAATRTAADRELLLSRGLARIEELARQLDLATPPSRVDLDRCAATLQRQWERRRQLDDLVATRAQAEARRAAADDEVAKSCRALTNAQNEYEAWCTSHGFAPTAPPDATLEAIAELAEVREQLEALSRVSKALHELEPSVAAFTQRCRRLFAAIDPALPSAVLCGDGATAENAAALESSLAKLTQLLEEATALEASRSALWQEEASAEGALESALGGGESAERVRSRLAGGDVLSWASERADLEPAIEALREAEETTVRRHQSLTEEMHRLATSAHIAELERRQDGLEVELDAVLRRYLVLGAARALLQRTLAQHERERQPAVVARAAAHFERVTGGRYVGLLADAGIDGRQTIRVLSAGGEVIDAHSLSRGTVEQLYLCLRLGLADSFAERSVSLPIVLDDVLVNFDPERARAVAVELAESARSHQVILLTCHPHLAEMVLRASHRMQTDAQLIQLGRLGQAGGNVEQLALAALAALPDLPQPTEAARSPASHAEGSPVADIVAG